MTQQWAIVGTGTISRSVVADLKTCAGADIAIVHSRDRGKAESFAQEFGIPRFTNSFDEVLDDPSIQVLYVATPFATHHSLTARALRAGKHVLVEKPMAMNVDEVRDVFRIARENNVFLMEAMWMKFSPLFRRLHSELDSGRIGEVRNLRAAFSLPMPVDGGSRWRTDGSPGSLLDQGIYPVTLAHSLFGRPSAILAAGTVNSDGIDLAEHFTLTFEGGRFAQCASGMTEFTDLSAAIGGRSGWITIAPPFWASSRLEVHADDLATIFVTPIVIDVERINNGYVPMLAEVIQSIDERQLENAVHGMQDTVEVFETLDAIRAQLDVSTGMEQAS